jgi:predicted phage terminase large subunit-like protein
VRREKEERQRRRDRERVRKDREGIRTRCEESLFGFIEEFWNILEPEQDFVAGWAIKAMALHLEAVTAGEIQHLLMTVPPGMMKSLILVFWTAWEWGPKGKGATRVLATSFSDKNVTRDISKIRRIVESEKFQALWPEVRPTPKWGEHLIVNSKTGNVDGRAFASMTGGRGDRVKIDDPHSVDTAESDTERANTIKTFREAIPDRLNDMARSSIVIIMQRLHEDDVAGTILKLRLPYVHLNLPMEFERYRTNATGELVPVEPCRTYRKDGSLLFEDPRTEEGELLFPERFNAETISGLKKSKGSYAYAGQYQQRPTAREGGLFKRAYFAGKIISRAEVPFCRLKVRAWDFASQEVTPGAPPDASAHCNMARDGSDYYVFDARKMFESPGVVEDTVKSYAEVDPPGTIIRIPQDPGQAGVYQVDAYVKALGGYTVSAVRPTGAKEVRATPLATQAEHGHVYLVNSVPIEEGGLDAWIEPFLDELCGFPNGPDDLVDAAADAFNELTQGFAGKFEVLTAGPRESSPSRDRRYHFGDNDGRIDAERGFGSAASRRRIGV